MEKKIRELDKLQQATIDLVRDMPAVLITHSTGTGKTRIGVGWRPSLIVAPAFLLPVWQEATGEQLPVISYHTLAKRLEQLSVNTERLLMDEAHILRNEHSITQVFKTNLRAKYLLMLTATPLSTDFDQYRQLHEVARTITGYPLTHVHAEPKTALPDVHVYYWDGRELLKQGECSKYISAWMPYPARLYTVRTMLEKASEIVQWKRALIFTHGRRLAEDIAMRFMGTAITGEVPPRERARLVHEWRQRGQKILAATWDSMGLGLDVPEADLILFTEVPHTPLTFYQCIGRARRIQRKDPITVIIYAPPIRRAEYALMRLNIRLMMMDLKLMR